MECWRIKAVEFLDGLRLENTMENTMFTFVTNIYGLLFMNTNKFS